MVDNTSAGVTKPKNLPAWLLTHGYAWATTTDLSRLLALTEAPRSWPALGDRAVHVRPTVTCPTPASPRNRSVGSPRSRSSRRAAPDTYGRCARRACTRTRAKIAAKESTVAACDAIEAFLTGALRGG